MAMAQHGLNEAKILEGAVELHTNLTQAGGSSQSTINLM